MIQRIELTRYLDQLLDIHSIPKDKSNNGLQIEGKSSVQTVIGSVDACLELYEKAAELGADFLIVHHGESWGSGFQYFTGTTARRFAKLFNHGISLYAAHLPLDAHRELGHNAVISSLIGLQDTQWFATYADVEVGIHGTLDKVVAASELANFVELRLDTKCNVYDFENKTIKNVGIISGAGANAIHECQAAGIDCLITGECNHTHYHQLKETGVVLITAGHYKTEVPGIVAVLNDLKKQFNLDCQFIDIPTGL